MYICNRMFHSSVLRFTKSALNPCITQTRNLRPTLRVGKDRFELSLDVHQFNRDELRVKARPEYVVIEGKQERETTNGSITRRFTKKFKLPNGCEIKSMKSELKDGVLTFSAKRDCGDHNTPCEKFIQVVVKTESDSIQPEKEKKVES